MPVMGVRVILFYCNVSAKYLLYISGGWVFCVGWLVGGILLVWGFFFSWPASIS